MKVFKHLCPRIDYLTKKFLNILNETDKQIFWLKGQHTSDSAAVKMLMTEKGLF